MVLPASGLAAALDIQADALRHSVIDADELARELQVIIQEAKRKLDTPGAVAHETLHEVMFDRHRIRRWRIGHEAQLAGFTRDDVHGYYARATCPSAPSSRSWAPSIPTRRSRWLASGLRRLARGRGAVDPSPEEPARHEVRARTLRGDVTQAELVAGLADASRRCIADAPALDLAAAVLGTGRGAGSTARLREPGLVTWCQRPLLRADRAGRLRHRSRARSGAGAAALDGIAAAVARLALLGPAGDLERARTLLRARWARRLESMEGRASALAAAEALDGYDSSTASSRRWPRCGPTTCARRRPASSSPIASPRCSTFRRTRRRSSRRRSGARLRRDASCAHRRRCRSRAPAGPASRRPPPAGGEAGGPAHALPGADLLVRRKTGVPLVHSGIYVPRLELDPPAQAGLGALTVRSAVRGAGDLDSGALAFAFERLGGTLGPAAASDWLGFGTTVLAEHLAEAAALLDLVFARPGWRSRRRRASAGSWWRRPSRWPTTCSAIRSSSRSRRLRRRGLRPSGGRAAPHPAGLSPGRRARLARAGAAAASGRP